MKTKLAKSNGETIIEHSENVYNISKKLLDIINEYGINVDQSKIINLAVQMGSLLHDIGKFSTEFQKMLRKNADGNELKYRHNEIGWAFIAKYVKFNDDKFKDYLLDSIYWHHGISSKMGISDSYSILNELEGEDTNNMLEYFKFIMEKHFNNHEYEILDCDYKETPTFYSNKDDKGNRERENIIKHIIRSCVVMADRVASNNMTDVDGCISKILNKSNDLLINPEKYTDVDRFKAQQNIALDSRQTTIVKAPAGYGKTLIGLLWAMKSNKKLFWVCPRNYVAESVYRSVKEELMLSNSQVSLELFIGGEVKESTIKNNIGFESDIIITNIDNFLAPTFKHNKLDHMFMVNTVDVIFDEYHELVSDDALFAGFINLMNIRHRTLKTNTLLLSATPSLIHTLWDATDCKTKLLPDAEKHYSAQHGEKYLFSVTNDLPDIVKNQNNLLKTISIKFAQEMYYEQKFSKLIHSQFEDNKRSENLNHLLKEYGKNSLNIGSGDVVGSQIIQSSLNVSFLNLYESVLSPECTLQTIGRIDRWGNYKNLGKQASINIYLSNNGSERSSRTVLYDNSLTMQWFQFLKNEVNLSEITLDELYELYNAFNIKHSKKINEFIRDKYVKSYHNLKVIYPFKFKQKKSPIMTAGCNKLRSSSSEIFFICDKTDNTGYSDVFSHSIRKNIRSDFKEDNDTLSDLVKRMKTINDERFDFTHLLKKSKNVKKFTSDDLINAARKSNTPYFRLDMVYDEEYGLIDRNTYHVVKNK